MLPELTREEATEAILAAIAELIAGRDPLRDRGLAHRYVGAVAQYVAPRMVAMARDELDQMYDELEAINLVVTQLELEAGRDQRRVGEGREGVLPRIAAADNPLRYLIRCATKVPNPASPRLTDRMKGWVFADLVPRREKTGATSLDHLLDLGIEHAGEPPVVMDDEGWHALADHAFDLLRPETPRSLWESVERMVEWCVSALPLVHGSQEHNRGNEGASRLRQAEDLFPELLPQQVDAVYKVLWGGLPDRAGSSLLAHVALVRNAHQYGEHDRLVPFERPASSVQHRTVSGVDRIRLARRQCVGCNTTPIAGDRLRALVDTYASRMAKSLNAAA